MYRVCYQWYQLYLLCQLPHGAAIIYLLNIQCSSTYYMQQAPTHSTQQYTDVTTHTFQIGPGTLVVINWYQSTMRTQVPFYITVYGSIFMKVYGGNGTPVVPIYSTNLLLIIQLNTIVQLYVIPIIYKSAVTIKFRGNLHLRYESVQSTCFESAYNSLIINAHLVQCFPIHLKAKLDYISVYCAATISLYQYVSAHPSWGYLRFNN